MTKAYFRVHSINVNEALKEVQEFLDESTVNSTVISSYGDTEVDEINTKIHTYLDKGLNYEEVFNVVSLVKDLTGLKFWCDISLILKNNNLTQTEEFTVLEHTLDLDSLKVIELSYIENVPTYIIEVDIES